MQEYVVLDIFCFCCTMLPTREVGEKNQDHVRHNVRLDPSYAYDDDDAPFSHCWQSGEPRMLHAGP